MLQITADVSTEGALICIACIRCIRIECLQYAGFRSEVRTRLALEKTHSQKASARLSSRLPASPMFPWRGGNFTEEQDAMRGIHPNLALSGSASMILRYSFPVSAAQSSIVDNLGLQAVQG